MSCDPHSTFGAFAVACLTIGVAFLLLGLAEWKDYQEHQKQKKENRASLFDIGN